MPDEYLELFRLHRAEQSKYVYFILAAAAGGIALAVRMTADATLQWSLAPLGAAVLAWGLSFYHGCQLLQCLQVLTRAEGELLQAESGQHPKAGPEPWKHGATVEALKEVLERENMALGKHDVRQFRYLVAGAVLFVGWHVLQIVLRSTH